MDNQPQNLSRTTAIIILVVIVLVIILGGYFLIKSQNQNQNRNTNITSNKENLDNVIGAAVKPNASNDKLTNVILQFKSGAEKVFGTFSDVYADHYHPVEYHNGTIYLIRRVNYTGPQDIGWSDELWKIDSQKKETKLYSAKGFDFRVAPNEQYISISVQGAGGVDEVIMLNTQGKELKKININKLSTAANAISIELLKWSDDGQVFWGNILFSEKPNFFRVIAEQWEISRYSLPDNILGNDYALNPNTGILAYSDHPVFLDEESQNDFMSKKTIVNFYIYNLLTGSQRKITTSVAKMFNPNWVNNSTIEYDNPNGYGKLSFTIDNEFMESNKK